VGSGVLLTLSIQEANPRLIISFCIFGFTLVLLYTASTLYHSFHPPRLKRFFQKLDHVSIYLLIAGTYTPYMLVSLYGKGGMTLLIWVWSLALIGLLFDIFRKSRSELLQMVIYLLMGWTCVFEISELKAAISEAGFIWLSLGGMAYTLGIIFYVLDHLKKLAHAHGIWHLFVLLGSICHFISIAAYVR
jgi:hemolysin III